MQFAHALDVTKQETQAVCELIRKYHLVKYEDSNGDLDLSKRRKKMSLKDIHILEKIEKYQHIKYWYQMAILELTTCDDFVYDYQWMAKKLKLKTFQVRDAIADLISMGLLKEEFGALKEISEHIRFPSTKGQYWVKNIHSQMIKLALDHLKNKTDRTSPPKRDISGITMTVDEKNIPKAKKLIRKFKQQMADVLDQEKTNKVYQLNIQLFPLTDD